MALLDEEKARRGRLESPQFCIYRAGSSLSERHCTIALCASDVGVEASFLPVDTRLAGPVCIAVNKVHSRLCQAITWVTNKDASSFASKYLHFHYRALFPMVDSRAREALKWIADEEGLVFAPSTAGMSKNYATYLDFYLQVRSLFEEELGRQISLRQMDNILLNRYDNWV